MEIYNPSAECLFGINADQVLGQHAGKLFSEDTIGTFQARVATKFRKTNARLSKKDMPMEDEEIIIKNQGKSQLELFL